MKKVFVALANNDYVKYSKILFHSAKVDGKWDGDFVLIIPEEDKETSKVTELTKLGVKIFYGKSLPSKPPVHFYKFYLFDEYFKKWDWIFFCDLDVLFLNKIKFNLEERDKSKLFANKDGLTLVEQFKGNDGGWDESGDDYFFSLKISSSELKKVRKKYGNAPAFQTCFLLFNKYLIEQNYFEKLYNDFLVYYCYHELARTNFWDQTIFNGIFYKKWESLGEEYINRNPVLDIINWKVEELENGYYDDTDYSDTIALHFFHFFQPWNKNNLRFYPKWKEYNDRV